MNNSPVSEQGLDQGVKQPPASEHIALNVIADVITWPNMLLREMSEPVDREADGEYVQGVCNMLLATMRYHGAVGMTAIQIGHAVRIAVIDVTKPGDAQPSHMFLINPKLLSTSKKTVKCPVGCLSMPGVETTIDTPEQITFEVDHPVLLTGRVVMNARRMVARNVLHQIDLMDGVMFWQRLGAAKQRLLLHRYDAHHAQQVAAHVIDAVSDVDNDADGAADGEEA